MEGDPSVDAGLQEPLHLLYSLAIKNKLIHTIIKSITDVQNHIR